MINVTKKLKRLSTIVCISCCFLTGVTAFAQSFKLLTVEECYSLAEKNYPLVKQMALIEKTSEYSIENAARGALPQFSLSGQATYQSEVTSLSIPGVETTTLSKDQYKIYGEISQSLTNSYTIKQQKELAEANRVIEQKNLEVEIYKLKERINQLFFGTLLIDAQIEQNALLKKDIQSTLDKTNASIRYGTALKSSANELKAELLNADQRDIELKANRKGYTDMLTLFINQPVDENTKLQPPSVPATLSTINRPELVYYDVSKRAYEIQSNLVTAKNIPSLSLFFQGGYGRPTLNLLSNDFDFYYIGGLRLNWNLSGLYTSKNEKQLQVINQGTLDIQKETFLLNTNLTMTQQTSEISKLQDLIKSDSEIIALREQIKKTANSQLENGTINTTDYLTYVNAEDQAKQNLLLHQIQLLSAHYNYKTTSGN